MTKVIDPTTGMGDSDSDSAEIAREMRIVADLLEAGKVTNAVLIYVKPGEDATRVLTAADSYFTAKGLIQHAQERT